MGRCPGHSRREPWGEDKLVLVYSTAKGLAAMTLALAHSRGWLDYDERRRTCPVSASRASSASRL